MPHPYQKELDLFDNSLAMEDYPRKAVIPQKYLGLDNTPFLYVETEE
jgi:exosome complex exonuclease RRP6